MFIFSVNEALYLVDTHPVNADAGEKFTGLILSTQRSNVDRLLHWIVGKLVLSNSKTCYQSMSIRDHVEKEISEDGKDHYRIFIEYVPQSNNFYKFPKFL